MNGTSLTATPTAVEQVSEAEAAKFNSVLHLVQVLLTILEISCLKGARQVNSTAMSQAQIWLTSPHSRVAPTSCLWHCQRAKQVRGKARTGAGGNLAVHHGV